MRATLWGLSTVLTLVIILLGTLAGLLATESGTRWLAGQAERLAPVELQIDRVEGTLFTELRLHGLHLALPDGPVIDLPAGRIGVSARSLLRGELNVRLLTAKGMHVDLPAPDADAPPAEEPFSLPESVRLPLAVRLGQLRVEDLEIRQAGEPLASISHLTASARARGSRIELQALELDMPEIQARLTGEIETHGDYALRLRGQWQAPLPAAAAEGLGTDLAHGELSVTGALRDRVQVEHDLNAGIQLNLQASARELFATPELELTAQWQPFTYHLDPGQDIDLEAGRLDLQGTPEDWALNLQTAATLTPWPRLALNTRAHGDLESLEIEALEIDSEAGRVTLAGPIRFVDTLDWDLTLEAEDLTPAGMGVEFDAGVERLKGRLQGTLPLGTDTPPLAALDASVTLDELTGHYEGEPITGSLNAWLVDGQARIEDTHLTIRDTAQLDLNASATGLAGDLSDPDHRLVFDLGLDLKAPDLARLHSELDGQIEQLRLVLDGNYAPASGALSAQLGLDPVRARLRGIDLTGDALIALTETGGEIERLQLATDTGARLALNGDLDWSEGLRWDLALEGDGLDPSLVVAEAPGQLALALTSAGHLDEDGTPRLQARLQRLEGTLRDQPVSGQAEIALEGQHLRLDRLDLALGRNTLTARGEWTDSLDFELQLDAPELDRAWPDLGGRLELGAHITGDPERPRVVARGSGSGLHLAEIALDRLELDADAGLEVAAPAEIDLRLSGLELGDGTRVESLRLDASGRVDEHRVSLSADAANLGSVELTLQGALDAETLHWRGQLARLELDQPAAGPWRLAQPVDLEGGPEQARLERLCLAREDGRVCAEARWSAAAGAEFDASIRAFDLAWVGPFLPPELAIAGDLNAEASGRVDADGILEADLAVTPTDGHLVVRDEDGDLEEIPYRDARLTAQIRDREIDAALRLDFLDGGTARSDIRLRPDGDDLRIDGDLVARLDDLAWLAALTPEVQRLRGSLDARLDFGGRLDAPLVEGEVAFREGGVLIPEAGIDVAIPEITARVVSAEQLALAGRLESGAGGIDLDGRVDLGEDGLRAELNLVGEDFLVVNRVDAEARITPDLQLDFTPDDGIRVRGEVFLPWARIRPPELPPGAIRVSGDEIILGEEIQEAQGLKTDIRIRIRLGDDVRFDGFGLTARFAGEVDVEEITGQPTQLFGEITIPEGQYSDYGQDLRVERGSLVFQGPAENPELDLRAVRTVREYNVTVGLEIRGTPDNLRSRVISDPAMDETEAMSYLLTGRPLSGASQSDGNMIAAAAAAYGLEQGAVITERIGRELGLDEVELDTEGGLDESALTLGLYLSPRLLLRYSIGLFDNTSKVLLRYELTRNLSVETASGTTEQSVDLIYRIER
ncbi:translocation/assembly module TamB domain-containing protein [Thioalkalivibrio sp. AKL19]|uniref:translocation/assembly module TamB domain-containing protein n=1 Tax=Thioalkalivibrio sp. AKL19 TaxID=1266914 RepID=UPI000462C61F|nr:translocation/assembly module TamB domain-containing protein [Thioalkalivibrio sp. AKL19]